MSTITLKNNTIVCTRAEKTLKERLADYYMKHQDVIIMGCYTAAGRIPDSWMLREMRAVQ